MVMAILFLVLGWWFIVVVNGAPCPLRFRRGRWAVVSGVVGFGDEFQFAIVGHFIGQGFGFVIAIGAIDTPNRFALVVANEYMPDRDFISVTVLNGFRSEEENTSPWWGGGASASGANSATGGASASGASGCLLWLLC